MGGGKETRRRGERSVEEWAQSGFTTKVRAELAVNSHLVEGGGSWGEEVSLRRGSL